MLTRYIHTFVFALHISIFTLGLEQYFSTTAILPRLCKLHTNIASKAAKSAICYRDLIVHAVYGGVTLLEVNNAHPHTHTHAPSHTVHFPFTREVAN